MDMDFATSCPLVRPCLPRIRLLFVGSRFRSTLPSDGPSQFRPCASLVLHLHQVTQGTFTPRLPDMPGTQPALGRAKGPRGRHDTGVTGPALLAPLRTSRAMTGRCGRCVSTKLRLAVNGTTLVSDERHAPGAPNWPPRAKVMSLCASV